MKNCTPLWREAASDVEKMARPCGAKRIFNSKYTKQTIPRPFFEVLMWKNGTPLWREARFQGKMLKTLIPGPFLQVRMLKNGTR